MMTCRLSPAPTGGAFLWPLALPVRPKHERLEPASLRDVRRSLVDAARAAGDHRRSVRQPEHEIAHEIEVRVAAG